MKKVNAFLWFDSEVEEAAKFYVGIFKNSMIGKITRYPTEDSKGSEAETKFFVVLVTFCKKRRESVFIGVDSWLMQATSPLRPAVAGLRLGRREFSKVLTKGSKESEDWLWPEKLSYLCQALFGILRS